MIPWGPTTFGLGFCMNSAAFDHDFRGVSGMKIVAFEHGYRDFPAWIPQFSGTNLAASRQEFGKVFALESSV